MGLGKIIKRTVQIGALAGSFYLGGTEEATLVKRYIQNYNKDFAGYSYGGKAGPLIRMYEGVGGTEWRLYDPGSGRSKIITDDMLVKKYNMYEFADQGKAFIEEQKQKANDIANDIGDAISKGWDDLSDWCKETF